MVGTGVLLVAVTIRAFSVSPSAALPTTFPSEPWLYIGGASGVIFIAIFALVVRSIGVLLMSLGSVAGQLVMAVILDLTFPSQHQLGVATIVGTVLTLLAAGIAAIPRRHTPHHQTA